MPGAEAGRVVADVLDGTVNPGGHLTFTIPHHIGQIPLVYNHRMGSGYNTARDASANMIFSGGYVDNTDRPLFPFGHGLSYTTFEVEDFALSADTLPTDGSIQARCRITNTGSRPGDQVLQLYYHFSGAHVIRPCMQLVGFVRVSLAPGESKQVAFTLQAAQLGYYNEEMAFVVEPGPRRTEPGHQQRRPVRHARLPDHRRPRGPAGPAAAMPAKFLCSDPCAGAKRLRPFCQISLCVFGRIYDFWIRSAPSGILPCNLPDGLL